jgi:TetR/AcrR family transcriptional regulator, cholesterol catabolism regulator
MWSFRRWALQKTFTLEEYIELQTNLLITGLTNMNKGDSEN